MTISSQSDSTETDYSKVGVGVDVGGTFTDTVLVFPDGVVTTKVPTTEDQSRGVVEGIRKACEKAGVDAEEIDRFSHAMTVSVNAVLERDGAETALVTTEGFRDVLGIGRQDRPDLYDLEAEKTPPLVPRERRYEIDERATPEGTEKGVDPDEVRSVTSEIEDDVEAVAVCLLHSYAHPENETRVAEIIKDETGSVRVSSSHEVLAEFREYERASTTALDAYVSPVIDSYLTRLSERTSEIGIPDPEVMQSNGGVSSLEAVRHKPVTTLFSGPAAGVVGAKTVSRGVDVEGIVTFDMGGTSTDVSLVRGGEIERSTRNEVGGHPVGVPMVDVETVGAGGGSIAWIDDGGALRVGPESAGADPGPACYGRGGEKPTVTDADAVLGYIRGSLGGEVNLRADKAREAVERLADQTQMDVTETAAGIHRVANSNTARAVRSATVERGHDPRGFGIVAYGGAGPMHAVAVADELGIETVVVPRAAGVLSAYGLLAADERHDAVRSHLVGLGDVDVSEVEAVYAEIVDDLLEETSGDRDEVRIQRHADLRYEGQSFELTVEVDDPFDPELVRRSFEDEHEKSYGYSLGDGEAVEVVSLRAESVAKRRRPDMGVEEAEGDPVKDVRETYFPGDGFEETRVYDRSLLSTQDEVTGRAVIEDDETTVVVPPSWKATLSENGNIAVEKKEVS
ncbi:MAG: hydantoinase/oxoprolinase family protein [Halobacteria archaeon]|nr:hydantoinase/oxoprolinase family protein [Halobacteria archaeon]